MVSGLLRTLIGAEFSLAARTGRLFYGFTPFTGAARDALIMLRSPSFLPQTYMYLYCCQLSCEFKCNLEDFLSQIFSIEITWFEFGRKYPNS
jgi:hypothetical protein